MRHETHIHNNSYDSRPCTKRAIIGARCSGSEWERGSFSPLSIRGACCSSLAPFVVRCAKGPASSQARPYTTSCGRSCAELRQNLRACSLARHPMRAGKMAPVWCAREPFASTNRAHTFRRRHLQPQVQPLLEQRVVGTVG